MSLFLQPFNQRWEINQIFFTFGGYINKYKVFEPEPISREIEMTGG